MKISYRYLYFYLLLIFHSPLYFTRYLGILDMTNMDINSLYKISYFNLPNQNFNKF